MEKRHEDEMDGRTDGRCLSFDAYQWCWELFRREMERGYRVCM